MMEIRETLERIIREEVSQEFNIPMICPPVNRVEDNICDRFLSKIQDTGMPTEETILGLIEDNLECKDDDTGVVGCHINGKRLSAKLIYDVFLAYHLRKMGERVDVKRIESICIRELWHPDLFDDLKIDPLDINKRQALKATASIITQAIAKEIRGEK